MTIHEKYDEKTRRETPEVFHRNPNDLGADTIFFEEKLKERLTRNAKFFFEEIWDKERNEFAPSADLLISEHDNSDKIYLVRYYYSEYRIGCRKTEESNSVGFYCNSFKEAYDTNLSLFFGKDITLGEWLEQTDFENINYMGNYAV